MERFYYITMLLMLSACSGNWITVTDDPVTDDPEDEDGITVVDGTISIVYASDGATVSGDELGIVSVKGNEVTVINTSESCFTYELSGTASDGFFKLYSDAKQTISLKNLSLTNPDGAAINNQSHKYTSVIVSGTNFLADGSVNSSGAYNDESSDEDMKAAFFSERQLIFSGDGSLTVTAAGKSGIVSDDYIRIMETPTITVSSSAKNGVKGKDRVVIDGGTLEISVSAAGAKGLKSEGNGYFNAGTVKVTNTGTSSGIGGRPGFGGWGSTTDDSSSKAAKAIKFDGDIYFNGTDVTATAASHEAIEAKGSISISAGSVSATSSDDAINSGSDMTITGGNVSAFSSGNDGLDANWNMYIKGGYIYAVGSGSPEVALDANSEGGYKLYISGGKLVAFGGIESGSSITQPVINVTSWTANASYTLCDTDGTELLKFTAPARGGNGMILSHPDLVSGNSYTLKSGSSSASVPATMSSSGSAGGGQGGGGFPGGGGGPGGRH